MRSNSMLLFLVAGAWLLAKSDPMAVGRGGVHSSKSPGVIIGTDVEQGTVDGAVHANVKNIDGRVVVAQEKGESGAMILYVPRQSSLDIVTSNAGIQVSGVVGPMRLMTSNGAIAVESAGGSEIHAHTTNGRIELGVARGTNATV